MSESLGSASTTKVGILWDWLPVLGDDYDLYGDYTRAVKLVFADALERHMIDRPIELVVRQCQGLPRGSVKVVIDAYKELVDAGCVLILGPLISDNAVDLRYYVESAPLEKKVPYVGWFGTEDGLHEWGFELNNGGHPEEALTTASIMHQDGIKSTVAITENSLIGQHYLRFFQDYAPMFGIKVLGSVQVPQIEADKTEAMAQAKAMGTESVLCLGFGYGLWGINDGMKANNWMVPRYCLLNFPAIYYGRAWMKGMAGFIGLDQYDERNPVAQQFLDRFEKKYGTRPPYYLPLYGYDHARIAVEAIRRGEPLSPRGVRDSLERIKGLPAACGSPGTWLKFGRYVHQGWMGSGFIVARKVNEEGTGTVYHGTLMPPTDLPL